MTEDKRKKLKATLFSLSKQRQSFLNRKMRMFEESDADGILVQELQSTVLQIEADFPHLLPSFNAKDFGRGYVGGKLHYDRPAIAAYFDTAITRLNVALDTVEDTPVTETREFAFVRDVALRKIIERDYGEIQRAYIAGCWKSVIILSGGAIETILLDLLQHNQSAAISASKAPRSKPDITKWDLSDLVNVAVELNLVSAGIEKLSHSVREYRNLIHPGNEIRNKLVFNAEEAKIALEVLHIVHRDLSPQP